jgi:hypothetical protein
MSSTAQGLSTSAEQLQALVARFTLEERHRGNERHRPVPQKERKAASRPSNASLRSLAKASAEREEAFEEF